VLALLGAPTEWSYGVLFLAAYVVRAQSRTEFLNRGGVPAGRVDEQAALARLGIDPGDVVAMELNGVGALAAGAHPLKLMRNRFFPRLHGEFNGLLLVSSQFGLFGDGLARYSMAQRK
jgi:hypothetical protein